MKTKPIEAHAADALLNQRLTINLPAPWLLRKLGKQTHPLRCPIPDRPDSLPDGGHLLPDEPRFEGAEGG